MRADPTASQLGTNAVVYSCDGNGNVSELVGVNGTIAAHYEYSPFGETMVATGPITKENKFRFSTKFTDDEMALVYYGYRYYSPSMGRWLSRDPIEEKGGKNLYSFVANDPVRLIDPHGKFVWAAVVVALEAVWDYYCNIKAYSEAVEFQRKMLFMCHSDYDLHGHCYAGCAFNRCKLGLSPFLSIAYSSFKEMVAHHSSWDSWWSHARADLIGIINSYSFKSCESVCAPCP